MNGYICFYNGKTTEVHADSTYEAQQKAHAVFQQGTRRKVKRYDITVKLAEKDCKPVIHTPDF